MEVTWKDEQIAATYVGARNEMPYWRDLGVMAMRLVHAVRGPIQRVVDLGCGDGVAGGAVLAAYPKARLIGVDFSPTMLDRARERFADDDRVCLIEADLQDTPLNAFVDGPVDVFISGFALHHLRYARQREVYAEAFASLRPGGLFVNTEHVAPGSPRLEALYWRAFYETVAAHRRDAGIDADDQTVKAEFEARRDIDLLSPVWRLCGWLEEIGYVDVDCLFKAYFMAVFGGYRPQPDAPRPA